MRALPDSLPDSLPGLPPSSSRITSVIRSSVPRSMPLAALACTAADGTRAERKFSRIRWAGTAQITASAAPSARAANAISGSAAAHRPASSALRQSTTASLPARAASAASVRPHDVAPTTTARTGAQPVSAGVSPNTRSVPRAIRSMLSRWPATMSSQAAAA